MYPLFGGLAHAVTSGANVWQQQMGMPGSDMFSALYSSPADLARFVRGMHSFAALSAPHVATAFDLSFAGTCVDVGGATGAILAEVLRTHPSMQQGVVLDLPAVAQHAAQHYVPQDAGAAARMRWQAGDFWHEGSDGVEEEAARAAGTSSSCSSSSSSSAAAGPKGALQPAQHGAVASTSGQGPGRADVSGVPQADLYILGRILHDWEQERCERLLRLLRRRVRPGGAVLLAEMLLPPDEARGDRRGPGPHAAGWDGKAVSAALQGACGRCLHARQMSTGIPEGSHRYPHSYFCSARAPAPQL